MKKVRTLTDGFHPTKKRRKWELPAAMTFSQPLPASKEKRPLERKDAGSHRKKKVSAALTACGVMI